MAEVENYALLMSMIEQKFTMDANVLQFMETHQFLAPLLVDAYPHIRSCFPDAALYLEIVVDPETNDHEQLVVAIASDYPPTEALAQYQHLKQVWWLSAMRQARGKLVVMLGYQ